MDEVTPSAVYKWLKDPHLRDPDGTRSGPRGFVPDIGHLTVLAHEQSRRGAWQLMSRVGWLDVSYETFARGLRMYMDTELVHGAIEGFPGLVENRAYLSWRSPHRNYMWAVDHTMFDCFVMASHKHTRGPIRPWVTVIVDTASSLVHAVAWPTPVTAQMVVAALTEFGTERNYFNVTVGGLPEQIVFDNAAQHLGNTMGDAMKALQWIVAPTTPYSPWQNGYAEAHIGLISDQLARRAPGAVKAGIMREHRSRYVPATIEQIKSREILPWHAFVALLQDTVDDINTTMRVRRHHGRTRLETYASDPTEQRLIPASEYRAALLTTGTRTYKYDKNGLAFHTHSYVDLGNGPDEHHRMRVGLRYAVRYLPSQDRTVEVFTETDEWVCTAVRNDQLTADERRVFMYSRERIERKYFAIEAGAQQHRLQIAAAARQQYGSEVPEEIWTGASERAALAGGTPTPGAEIDLVTSDAPADDGFAQADDSEDVDEDGSGDQFDDPPSGTWHGGDPETAADGDATDDESNDSPQTDAVVPAAKSKVVVQRPSRGPRPKMPRALPPAALAAEGADTTSADDRLFKRFGGGLFDQPRPLHPEGDEQ